jgi:hypothetical protein
MTFERARAVADAVLFEGYLLYPYRASALKNRMRWQFGVLAPCSGECSEPWFAQTECVADAGPETTLDVRVRFLQLHMRASDPAWDEGVVREVEASVPLGKSSVDSEVPFRIPGEEGPHGGPVWSWPLSGAIRIQAPKPGAGDPWRMRVIVENRTPWEASPSATRDEMLRRSLVSAHTLLAVRGGSFASLLDPPEWARAAAESCRNVHTWPVLAGEPGEHDVMLSAPIILYDHPAVAPQSPGDLFDATEIDEILTLRTMTLTDEEKREARATDPRAAAIIDRTENLPREMIERMHGTVRSPRKEA